MDEVEKQLPLRLKRTYFRWSDRLWKRFQVDGVVRTDPPTEWPRLPCWLWIGGVNGNRIRGGKITRDGGYGYIRGPDGKMTRVHILSYRELRGPIEDGYLHRHTCDIHRCGNPWHIEPGTSGENNQDMYDRNRR